MTLHAYIDYQCENCGTYYVPLSILQRCPKCGNKSSEVFNYFIEATIRSALYNLKVYGSFIPGAWGVFSIGDHYYWLAFNFLSFTSSLLNIKENELFGSEITEDQARKIASQFLEKLNFGKRKYMANAYEIYLTRILCSPEKEKTITAKTDITVSCFLSHCVADKTFCEKLNLDLIASGIKSWYFPEDAIYGKKMWGEIDGKIVTSNKVVVICSKNSLVSEPVLREIERALQREDFERKDILLPIRIDDYVLNEWNHPRKADVVSKVIGDFQKWKNPKEYTKSFNRLINAITT
jgi:hypothetical protein